MLLTRQFCDKFKCKIHSATKTHVPQTRCSNANVNCFFFFSSFCIQVQNLQFRWKTAKQTIKASLIVTFAANRSNMSSKMCALNTEFHEISVLLKELVFSRRCYQIDELSQPIDPNKMKKLTSIDKCHWNHRMTFWIALSDQWWLFHNEASIDVE